MTIADILVALRAHYKTGEYQVHIPMHDIVNVIKGIVEAPLLAEIAQLNTEKQNMASQLAYLSHVRLDDWSRNNTVQTSPTPAVPPRTVKFEIDGVQWYPYTSSSAMPGMSYYTAFPVYLLVRDKTTQTLQQLKYPDGLTMHSNLTEDIIGYRFINESDDPFYNTPINYSVYYNTTEPHMFTALGKIWISHSVGDNKCPVGCSESSRSLTETYTVIRGGSASINWETKIGWYPVDKHGNDLPSGTVYKFKAAVLAGKKVEFYDSTLSAWYGITARWFAEMDNKATTNIAAATNPDCYRIVEYTPATKPTMTPSDKDRIALAKWYVGNDTGISSKAMAAVYLAGCNVFDKGTDNTPRDAPDLGRCIRLVALCPDIIKVAFPILRTTHPVWAAYVDNWNDLVLIHSIGDYYKTTELMDKLCKAAVNKPDPLQHVKDALKAGRLVQRRDSQDHQWYYTLSTVCPYTEHAASVAWYNNPDNYRVLLNHTDITPTTVFRNKGVTTGYVAVSEVSEAGVYFNNNQLGPWDQLVSWNTLAEYSEYSHDGVTWKPCFVPQHK